MKKRLLALLLCMTVVAGLFAGCTNKNAGPTEETYSVTVVTAGKKLLADAKVEVYEGTEVVASGTTNSEGKIDFVLPTSDTYKVVVSGIHEMYTLEESYSFTDKVAEVVPGSVLPTGAPGRGVVKEGDTMFEFTFQSCDGTTYSLTDLLTEKELVVLNFWFSTCGYCSMELPFLIETYKMYKDNMEILALNPFDDLSNVRAYITSKGVPYPMGQCSGKWETTFGLRGYPTSVLIDRNGVVKRIIVGALDSTERFCEAFEPYFGDDYQP